MLDRSLAGWKWQGEEHKQLCNRAACVIVIVAVGALVVKPDSHAGRYLRLRPRAKRNVRCTNDQWLLVWELTCLRNLEILHVQLATNTCPSSFWKRRKKASFHVILMACIVLCLSDCVSDLVVFGVQVLQHQVWACRGTHASGDSCCCPKGRCGPPCLHAPSP